LVASKQYAERTSRALASTHSELETATARLVEAEQLAAVGRVVTGIAHEISNQLALVGYAEAIKSRVEPSSELFEFADAIALAQKRLATMIAQIRSFATSERQTPEAEPASLRAVVDEAVGILRYDRDAAARNIVRRYSATPLVLINREQFDQVVLNLVTNSVQATNQGDSIDIEIEEMSDKRMAVLTVRDSGEGMPPEVLQRLGQPFFTTRGDRGSGLGIGICMSIVEGLGGSMIYSSELGVGTTAKVRLPLLPKDYA
jgi:C4-dicarboxylate-specific signal transduction histidine kinase